MKTLGWLLLTTALLFQSCGEDKKEETKAKQPEQKTVEPVKDPVTDDSEIVRLNFDAMFSNVPSPYMMAKQIKTSGAEADPDMLHDYEIASKYDSEKKRALNLGVYAADLTYAHVMDTGSDEIQYMAAFMYLTHQLGLENVLDEDAKLVFEDNLEDHQKSMAIINDIYTDLMDFLREENREALASYIMSGAMIEVLYLASHMSDDSPELRQVIADQHIGVDALSDAIDSGIQVDEDLLNDLKAVKAIYDKMETAGEIGETVEENGETIIGAKPEKQLTPELLQELKMLSESIRARYTE